VLNFSQNQIGVPAMGAMNAAQQLAATYQLPAHQQQAATGVPNYSAGGIPQVVQQVNYCFNFYRFGDYWFQVFWS
jgi:hypothetical protein